MKYMLYYESMNWDTLASEALLQTASKALEENGFVVSVVNSGEEAKEKTLSLIPENAEVMTMTSRTLDDTGINKAINESSKYNAIHPKVIKMDRETQAKEIASLRSIPDYAVGSVHGVTSDGKLLIASRTGSQLPAYVYGSKKVIFVVGTQKIVPDIQAGFQRLDEHTVPLESERINKVYNMTTGSFISKLVIYYREEIKERVHIILVKEVLGF